jgi:hypothetical protein
MRVSFWTASFASPDVVWNVLRKQIDAVCSQSYSQDFRLDRFMLIFRETVS